MAFCSPSTKVPMVIIAGATGTGKTKLGLELAQRYASEIISADSMQIYKGLDIVTAKATPEERALVKHHLVDILEPHEEFSVLDFRNRSLKIIDELAEQGRIPFVVGGTNYYLESIVYHTLVENTYTDDQVADERIRQMKRSRDDIIEQAAKKKKEEGLGVASTSTSRWLECLKEEEEYKQAPPSPNKEVTKEKIQEAFDNEKNLTNEEVHETLRSIDPLGAQRLHVNNRRKVLRSIEVWLKKGRPHSEILIEQEMSEGKLRRPGGTIILWLQCNQTILNSRLDKRINEMMKNGLVQELLDFHAKHNKQRMEDGKPPDYTKGIFQSVGFKEFHPYLMLPEEERKTEAGELLLKKSIAQLSMATRRYSRRQDKMVDRRFLNHPFRDVPNMYALDVTHPEDWDKVVTFAIHIIESYIKNIPCEIKPLERNQTVEPVKINFHSNNYCSVCDLVLIGDLVYESHMKSMKHRKTLLQKKKLEEKS